MRARDRLEQNLAARRREREQEKQQRREQVIAEFDGDQRRRWPTKSCVFGTAWRSLQGLPTHGYAATRVRQEPAAAVKKPRTCRGFR
jgi:hypothetical protein